MIAPNAGLSVNRQCTLLGIARSSFYYQRRPVSAEELDLLNRLDQMFTAHPVYGSRRLQVALLRERISVGRRRIRRLMRKLGLCAIRPKRNQQAASRAQDLSLFAAPRDDRLAEPSVGNRHYIPPDASRVSISGCDHRLGNTAGSVLASVEHSGGGVLRRRPQRSAATTTSSSSACGGR
jgi:transposase InsO family protein